MGSIVHSFFKKIEEARTTQIAFQKGVTAFLQTVQKRAAQKQEEQEEQKELIEKIEPTEVPAEHLTYEQVPLVEAMYIMSPEERKGPGGLDALEVFESLPPAMQECFKLSDVDMLKRIAKQMNQSLFG